MNKQALQDRVQLLLSWREKAAEQRGALPGLRGEMRATMRRADYYLAQSVEDHQRYVERIGAELHGALAEMGRVDQRAATNRIRPDDAALAKAEIERRVNRLRLEVQDFNRILRAKRSDEVGGFVDLPLDDYPTRLGILPIRRAAAGWKPRDYATILLITAVASFAAWWFYNSAATTGGAVCEGVYQPAPDESVSLQLTNTGNIPLQVYAPWPNPVPPGMAPGACGLSVFIRATDSDRYQLAPTTADEWLHLGASMMGLDSVSVPPAVAESFQLKLSTLRLRAENLQGIRITLTDASGAELCAHEWEALPAPPSP